MYTFNVDHMVQVERMTRADRLVAAEQGGRLVRELREAAHALVQRLSGQHAHLVGVEVERALDTGS